MPIKKFRAKTGRIHTINEPEDWVNKLTKKVKAYFAKEKKKKKKQTFTQAISVEGRMRKAGFPENRIKKYKDKK